MPRCHCDEWGTDKQHKGSVRSECKCTPQGTTHTDTHSCKFTQLLQSGVIFVSHTSSEWNHERGWILTWWRAVNLRACFSEYYIFLIMFMSFPIWALELWMLLSDTRPEWWLHVYLAGLCNLHSFWELDEKKYLSAFMFSWCLVSSCLAFLNLMVTI